MTICSVCLLPFLPTRTVPYPALTPGGLGQGETYHDRPGRRLTEADITNTNNGCVCVCVHVCVCARVCVAVALWCCRREPYSAGGRSYDSTHVHTHPHTHRRHLNIEGLNSTDSMIDTATRWFPNLQLTPKVGPSLCVGEKRQRVSAYVCVRIRQRLRL